MNAAGILVFFFFFFGVLEKSVQEQKRSILEKIEYTHLNVYAGGKLNCIPLNMCEIH